MNYLLKLKRRATTCLCLSVGALVGLYFARLAAWRISLLMFDLLKQTGFAYSGGASQEALHAYLLSCVNSVLRFGQTGILAGWGMWGIVKIADGGSYGGRELRNGMDLSVSRAEKRSSLALLTLVLLAVMYTPHFLATPRTFAAGDGGVKYMQIQHIWNGVRPSAFDIDAHGWVKEAWERYDSFPVEAPFVHYDKKQGVRYMAHPLPFVYLSAVSFSLFGHGGLFVLPIIATCVTMVIIWLACGRSFRGVLWALLVVCGTPLLYFTMTFWEHAVVVPFVVCALILAARSPTPLVLLLSGCLLGLPVFFRSECLVLYIAGFALVAGRPWKSVAAFGVGLFVSGCLYLILNLACYGSFVPPHAGEVAARSLLIQLGQSVFNLASMTSSLLSVCPFICFAVLSVRSPGFDRRVVLMCLIAGILTAFIVPNSGIDDFGPRFWLFFVPSLMLLALQYSWSCFTPIRRLPALFVLLYSVAMTIHATAWQLPRIRLERTWPVFDLVEKLDSGAVLVGHQFAAQEMAVLLTKDRPFFRVTKQNEGALFEVLSHNDVASFSIVTYPDDRWGGWIVEPETEFIPYQVVRSYNVGIYRVTHCRLAR